MAEHDDLLSLPGAVGTGEFAPDGRLVRFQSPGNRVTADLAAIAARFGATVSMVTGTLAAAFSELSGLAMVPEYGWIYSGGEWTGMVTGHLWAIAPTADSPFAAAVAADRKRRALADLLDVPGVVDVGEFDGRGTLVAHESRVDLSEDLARQGARFMHTTSTTLDGLGEAFGTLSRGSWTPQQGWLYSGGEYAVVVSGGRWALAESGGVVLTELYAAVLEG